MPKDKRSFFERLTGTVKMDHADDDFDVDERESRHLQPNHPHAKGAPHPHIKPDHKEDWAEEAPEEGQLTVDVYQTANDIVIKTIVAGVRPEDLDISITRDMVTIKGRREEAREVSEEDFFHRELYWGAFTRTVLLPEEIDVEAAEANERHGLLTIKLPKLDKRRQTKLRVKSNS